VAARTCAGLASRPAHELTFSTRGALQVAVRTNRKPAVALIAAIWLVSLGMLPRASAAKVHFLPRASVTVGGSYQPLQPARILDTRTGTGGVPAAPISAAGQLTVNVAGQGGVAGTAAAVVVNVTVTNTTAPSFLTVYPAGLSMPLASNLNWVPGQTVANLVEVPLGTGGAVNIYNSAGAADVIMDVEGYYSSGVASGPSGLYNPLVPARLLDTRSGNGAPTAQLGAGGTLNLQVTGRGNVPSTGVSAIVMNLTVTGPSASSFLTAWPAGAPRPMASNLNFSANQTVANRVVVPVGAGGQVSLFNDFGSTDVVADVNGWFTDGTAGGTGSGFTAVTPSRILDSRNNTGGFSDPWGPASGRAVNVSGVGGVPAMTAASPPTAIVANVTVTDTSAPSWLTAWPDGAAQPLASDLNWKGGTVPNLVVVQVGSSGAVDLYNAAGCADVVVDVVGYFTGPAPAIASGPAPPWAGCSTNSWLARLNYWRSTAGVPPVTENTTWSAGDYDHALWMIKNQLVQHSETVGSPYYTAAGNTAAQASNIAVQSSTSATDVQFVDWWMGAPFHAMAMVDPRLQQSGFGSYREAGLGTWQAGAALNVLSGNPFTGGTYPVYWPGNGSTVPLRTYSGNESPDPLKPCGYSGTVGLPVFVQVGGGVATTASAHSFTGNGTPLAHCVLDSTNSTLAPYLTPRGGVIVVPEAPLQPGVLYVVTLTVNGSPYTWSFHVA